LPSRVARRTIPAMSSHHPSPAAVKLPPNARVAVIAARFNDHIVDTLLKDCVHRLEEAGVEKVAVYRVPGAFELPTAAKMAARTRQFHAVICLGCIIRGDTPHFDFVAGEAAAGISRVALDEVLPVIFGVLTTNTEQQAIDRTNGVHSHAGINSADAALEMIGLAGQLKAAMERLS